MTKLQIWNETQELLAQHPTTSKALISALETLLAPKQGGGSSTNPPKEIDGVMHYYCRFHQAYETEENMVMSKEKSKGYCKASISLWNKTNSQIKKYDSEVADLVADGNFEDAQTIAQEAKDLKAKLNDPSEYDLVRDWALFETK